MVWTSFWYQYLVGGLIFFTGLWFCWRQGEVGLGGGKKRRNLIMLLGGFLFMFGLHLGLMLIGSGG